MMTDKEKNWVTNVQMLQLQIDDPYRYDFYYTAWMLKKKQFAQRNTSSAGLKTSVIHSLDNKYNTNLNRDPKTYRPLTFENSLGKVTMSNFHHPRALIDVRSGDDQAEADLGTSISELDIDEKSSIDKEKNIDTILLEIEKMYQVLLNIDEIEHGILKANEEMRALLFQDRRAKVDKLALMLCTDNFAHYLFIDKGKFASNSDHNQLQKIF
jgi:DNA topoisomerase 2-associated protein PAT1